ncbi:MAG: sulfur oxidation c-type cytochrome SoxA [Gammaproteobacteria bacterium]|nr:MAG: sulfur oxidation c-type cytochrome SoxA [Gammaproteobacteria bacterium]RLA51766.1 MAG: sulfur oxidation c-type cytochrome SoxA [Gammaproteobacteria bacterium]
MLLTLSSYSLLGYMAAFSHKAVADPESDRQAMRAFYQKRFPDIAPEAHKDGVYAFDENAREQWLELEDFPPYEIAIDEGQELFESPLADGSNYSDCFGDGAVKNQFPYFDEQKGEVITLELAINTCRSQHGDQPLPYDGAEITRLTAYIAFQSRGQTIAVAEPANEGALAAYNDGKRFYASRRGQLNFACTSCHVQLAGNRLRAEHLSASLGQVSHWPAYRLKWQDVGSLHRRFARCIKQVGAEPFPAQSKEYRNLEYFLTYISNGLPLNGPSIRK